MAQHLPDDCADAGSVREVQVLDVARVGQHFDVDRWREDGFTSEQDSREWSDRACGIACMVMVLDHFGADPVPMHDLLARARTAGAHSPRGWIHYRLADLLREHGIDAAAVAAPEGPALAGFLTDALAQGPVIASVTLGLPVDGRCGGHLILLTGLTHPTTPDPGVGGPVVHFNDPSTWGRSNASVPLARFAVSFSGRAVLTAHPAVKVPLT